MWLSKPVYEFLPVYYLGIGLFALTASFYLDYGYWPVICLVVAMIGLAAGVGVAVTRWLLRRSMR